MLNISRLTKARARTTGCMLLTAVVVLLAVIPASAVTWAKSYDAVAGSVPDAQGWAWLPGTSPTPTVSGGTLNQGPTGVADYQSWSTQDAQNDFGGATPFILEARLKVISSNYALLADSWRAGYTINAADNVGGYFALGITDTGVRVSNAGNLANAGSSAFIDYDTTSALRTYRLVLSGGIGQLYIDNNYVTSLATGPAGTYAYTNKVIFGDTSRDAGNQTQLQFLHYGQTALADVPEPSSLMALGASLVGLLGLRRRK